MLRRILTLLNKTLNLIFSSFIVLVAVSEPAMAGLSFTTGVTTLGNDIMSFLAPLAGIVIIALGVGAWMGKISWAWCITFVLGMILVFGHQQILDWIKATFGF